MDATKCKKCRVKHFSKQTTAMKVTFFSVLNLVIKRFSAVVDPHLLLASLPTAIRHQLQGAKTIEDIFKAYGPLDGVINWCNFGLLVKLVNLFGDQKCIHELNDYIALLEQYIKARSRLKSGEIIQELPDILPDTTPSDETGAGFTVACAGEVHDDVELVVDAEWEEALLQNEASKGYIASLLGTTPNHLHFSRIQY